MFGLGPIEIAVIALACVLLRRARKASVRNRSQNESNDEPAENVPATRRGDCQFSLSTLFLLVTFAAMIIGYPALKVTERRLVMRDLKLRRALVVTWSDDTGHDPPTMLTAFGAKPVQWIEIPPTGFTWIHVSYLAGVFPEASIIRPAGPPIDEPITFWIFLGYGSPFQAAR